MGPSVLSEIIHVVFFRVFFKYLSLTQWISSLAVDDCYV